MTEFLFLSRLNQTWFLFPLVVVVVVVVMSRRCDSSGTPSHDKLSLIIESLASQMELRDSQMLTESASKYRVGI